MSGVEASRRIKDRDPQVQVIFLTFYGDASWDAAVKEADALCFLVKGCPPAMITELIHRAPSHRRHADRGGTSATG